LTERDWPSGNAHAISAIDLHDNIHAFVGQAFAQSRAWKSLPLAFWKRYIGQEICRCNDDVFHESCRRFLKIVGLDNRIHHDLGVRVSPLAYEEIPSVNHSYANDAPIDQLGRIMASLEDQLQ
jgi:hypothetical protein